MSQSPVPYIDPDDYEPEYEPIEGEDPYPEPPEDPEAYPPPPPED